MKRGVLFLCILLGVFRLQALEIAPSTADFTLFYREIALTKVDSQMYLVTIDLVNNTDLNQTYAIESAQSGTDSMVVFSKYDAHTYYSKISNSALYFYSNIFQHFIQIPPHSHQQITCKLFSMEPQPILIVQSEQWAQNNIVRKEVLMGVFYGISVTLIIYLMFLLVSTRDLKYLWFILYVALAIIFMFNRLNMLTDILPNFVNKHPIFFDDFLVIVSMASFILFSIDLIRPSRNWRIALWSLIGVKVMLFLTAMILYQNHVAIFQFSRQFSGLATLMFIPLFKSHYKNNNGLFYMFVIGMLGIAATNFYFNIIDYTSIIEKPRIYLKLLAPFIVHLIVLAGTFLLELQILAENKQTLEQNIIRVRKENHASFIKGTQIEHKNLAEKIEKELLDPINDLRDMPFVSNEAIQKELTNTSRDLTRIIKGITPENAGFEKQLYAIIDAVNNPEKYNLNVFITKTSLSRDLISSLIRITQEAINNIEKHAEATRVNIEFFSTNSTYFLSIYDNGKGFDTYQNHSGIGLKNMEKYVQEQNGRLTITSSHEQGTTLLFSFKIA